jgi:hypothetical protein
MKRRREGFEVSEKKETDLEVKMRCLCEAPPALALWHPHSSSQFDLPMPSLLPLQREGVAALDALLFSVPSRLSWRPPRRVVQYRHVVFCYVAPASLHEALLAQLLAAPSCEQPLPVQLPAPNAPLLVLLLSSFLIHASEYVVVLSIVVPFPLHVSIALIPWHTHLRSKVLIK